jgi:hypothetical protein
MPNKHLSMKMSRDEEIFLRHWIYDEAHYRERTGPAKRLQVDHRAIPADLGTIIAAAIPCLADQEAAALGPPPSEPPAWPWPGDSFAKRLADAEAVLFGKKKNLAGTSGN